MESGDWRPTSQCDLTQIPALTSINPNLPVLDIIASGVGSRRMVLRNELYAAQTGILKLFKRKA